ncbi:MAG: hypothetical protein QOG72_1356 [Sphingomonadales bacterium]|jgi:Ca2+-binding RTX toxin-like protein|nr:hypothetical protein [Sphingomonadales bacterium]
MAEFVYAAGVDHFTLGPGLDTVRFPAEGADLPPAPIVITNFQTGPTGDRLDFADWLVAIVVYWDYYGDPIASGYLKLEQDGADTVILIDRDGPYVPDGPGPVPWLRLEGVQIGDLTAENLGGYDPTGTLAQPPSKVVTGTDADELIIGLIWHDTLDGGGGNDQLVGGHGFDILRGGDGDDLLQGEQGQDALYGGAGADRLEGGSGDDSLQGDAGDDILLGGEGRDSLSDGFGNNIFDGGAGDDWLFSSNTGNDLLIGGAGDDSLSVSRSSLFSTEQNRLEGGEGNDRLYVSVQNRGLVEIDAGTGSDRVTIDLVHDRLNVRLDPDGTDTVTLNYIMSSWYSGAAITIDGFARGDSGAVLVWDEFLGRALTNWDGTANPFGSGHARIVTIGGRQILQIDPNGGANGWVRLMDLGADTGQAFTAHNFDGFAPDGSVTPGLSLTGTPDPDQLNGGNGSDTIAGLDDADLIYGHAGADSISGGGGDDAIDGGPGADLIEGGEGEDALFGGAGDDVIHGGPGNDRIEENMVAGAGGNDSLYGDGGDDFFLFYRELPQPGGVYYLSGGDGNDRMWVGVSTAGVATVDGGAGDDDIVIITLRNGAAAVVTLGAGQDILGLTAGRFHTAGNSTLTVTDFVAGAGGDRIDFGNSLTQWLSGWTPGTDPFASGHFRLAPVAGGARLSIDPDGGGNGFLPLVTLLGVDPLALTAFNLGGLVPPIVTFTDAGEEIAGTAGTDLLQGLGGGDLFLLQQGGDDAAAGGAGNDILYFGAAFTGNDQANGGADRDVVVLQGNYALTLSATNLTGVESLSLQSGSRTTWGDVANNFYDYAITTNDANVAAGQQLIVNGQTLRAGEDFTFDGSAETDGYFLVYGGHGVDTLKGGAGNDAFFFEGDRWGAGDTVDGGAGRDAVIISSGSGINHFDFGANALTGIESISLNNRYTTDPTQKPSYELVLSNGNVAPGATLIVNGSSLADRTQTVGVDGSEVHDGNLILFGGFGNDTLIGGDGADLFQGGEGVDMLTGGGGADVFRYAGQYDATSQLPDRILDFASGVDKIDLTRIDADLFTAGDQAFHWIGSGAFGAAGAASAGELRAYAFNGSWYVEGDMDGNGSADLVIQLTIPAAPPVQGDFLL